MAIDSRKRMVTVTATTVNVLHRGNLSENINHAVYTRPLVLGIAY